MRLLTNLRIRSKILLMLLIVGMGSIAIIGYLGYNTGRSTLRQSMLRQFAYSRAAKSFEIEAYFDRLQRQVQTLSEDLMVVEAMKSFNRAFHQLNTRKIPPGWRKELESYYRSEFIPALRVNGAGAGAAQSYVPATPAAQYLQYLYIVKNPNPAGRRRMLVDAGDGSEYSKVHATYQTILRDCVEKFRIYDMMLVDTASGDVVYTVQEEPDFASNVDAGPFRGTNFSRAVQQSRKGTSSGYVKFVDFETYPPSEGAPAAFAASPIFDGDRHIGDLVFQLPIDEVDRIMTNGRHWREAGLGETGENYLVGPDYLMRSDCRLLLQDPKRHIEVLRAAGVPQDKLQGIERFNTCILHHPVKSSSVEAAFQGRSSVDVTTDPFGQGKVSSYSPLNIQGLRWVLVSEIDLKEALAPIRGFQRRLLLWSVVIVLVAMAIALWMAHVFVRPIRALMEGARRFGAGQKHVFVPVTSGDEHGKLTSTFNDMVRNIREKAKIIEQKNAENERLLLNILPGPIAQRLKMGEKSIADGFAPVTVLFADLVGFTAFSASRPAEQLVSFLNDLFRRYDEAAAKLGIEKIKTIGDCYMAVSGLPSPRRDHVRVVVEMALEMLRILREFNAEHGTAMQIRVGINTGPVVAGVIGASKFIYDLWGDTVNLASRMESTGVPGAVQVSESVYEELRGQYEFEERGFIEVKGKGKLHAWILREQAVPSELLSKGRHESVCPGNPPPATAHRRL